MELREQLKRIALRLGIVLKSCETDMQVNSHFDLILQRNKEKERYCYFLPLIPLGKKLWLAMCFI